MTPAINESLRQNLMESRKTGYGQTQFTRSPMEKSIQSQEDHTEITMWVGVKIIVVSIPVPDGERGEIRSSVIGNRLMLQRATQENVTEQSFDLPCPVEPNPIPVVERDGFLYVVLQKK